MDTELVFTFRSSFHVKTVVRVRFLWYNAHDNTIIFMLSSTAYEGIRVLSKVIIHIAHALRTFCILTTRHTMDDVMLPHEKHEIIRNNYNKHADGGKAGEGGKVMNLHKKGC